MESKKVSYKSRGMCIKAILTLPEDKDKFPLLLMCHGHGRSKHENGGYDRIAEVLAEGGIASIRMDYPGCGESDEDFSMNCQSNMKEDSLNAIKYVKENYDVDEEKIALFGYSMGGRIALELVAEKLFPFASLVLLAPAGDIGDVKNFFSDEGWDELKKKANESEDGYVPYRTKFKQDQKLSPRFFDDIDRYQGDSLVGKASAAYDRNALLIYSTDDFIVHFEHSRKVAKSFDAEFLELDKDAHSYGFYSKHKELVELIAKKTLEFLANDMV